MSVNFYCSLEIQTEHAYKNKTDKENYFFETNWIKIFTWELSTFFMKPSIADLTWNLFLLFLNIFPSKNPHFCTAVLDTHMKLLNKCRIIPKEYQINSSYQTVVQFESKLISIRRAKLYYIKTSFTRRVFKFKS